MADDFFPVPLKKIVVDSVPDFDLFIRQKDRYILYRKANIAFKKESLNNLIRNNVEDLFVRKDDYHKYEQYRRQVSGDTESSAREQGYDGIFTDSQQVERYHQIIADYHVIDPHIFTEGAEIDFPIFVHKGNDVNLCPLFEGNPEGPWVLPGPVCTKKEEIMIRKKDLPKYRAFVKNQVSGVKGQAVERKAAVIREMSKMVVQDVLDDPRSGENIEQVDNSVKDMVGFILENETSYLSMMTISSHDFYTYTHSLNVCTLALGLGSAVGLPQSPDLQSLGLGAMLHDVGKSQIDPKLINKPGRFTEEEYAQMKGHVAKGVNLLKEHHKMPEEVLVPVAQHHEKLTGNGYPAGLKGDQLSILGRISSIVDIYDALTTVRSYKKAFSPFEALSFLSKTEKEYDRNLLKGFVLMLGRQIQQKQKS